MPYAYVTVNTLKGTGVLNIDGTAYDSALRRVAEDIASHFDRFANRNFQPRTETLTFDGDNSTILHVPDLISMGTLKEDTNRDGTFETTWASTSFLSYPLNAQPTAAWGRSYQYLRVNPASNGTQTIFLAGPNMYQAVGTWGYSSMLTTAVHATGTAITGSGSLGSAATAYTVVGSGIEIGHTILVDSEQMYVRNIDSAGTLLTITRGENGSTAATHASAVAISVYTYPGPVVEAAIIQASRIWQRRNSGFANQVGIPDTGVIVSWRGGLDPDVREMLNGYRRMHV